MSTTMQSMHTSGTPEKKGRGCLFYFFVSLIVFIVALGGAAYYGYKVVVGKLGEFVQEYTSDQPAVLPEEQLTNEEVSQTTARAKEFFSAVDSGGSPAPLVLTGKDINALIAGSPELAPLKDSIHVSVNGSDVSGEISLPLEEFGYAGRYLNGKATFSVQLIGENLDVRISELIVKGQPAPEAFMTAIQGQNLAENSKIKNEQTKVLDKIERLDIRDGKVIITPKT